MHRSHGLQGSLKRCYPPFHTSINGYHTSKGSWHNRLQNGPHSLLRVKVGTHSPLPTGSYTAAYTAKQGRFRWGRYYYPRTVSHVSETLRGQGVERQTLPLFGLGRGCSQRTQRAFGTAMRYACRCSEASRPRWAAQPLLWSSWLSCFCLKPLLQTALRHGTMVSPNRNP